jgi:hypothetical protein
MKRVLIGLGITLAVHNVSAAEIQHTFNSPAFSGVGYSSHVLTLKQLEDQQKEKNKAAVDALKAAAEREAANTPQARFKASMETRVYSELAKRISDSLFGSTTTAPTCNGGGSSSAGSPCAAIELVGQNISWWISGSNIIVRIQDANDPNTFTEMTMPYSAFKI